MVMSDCRKCCKEWETNTDTGCLSKSIVRAKAEAKVKAMAETTGEKDLNRFRIHLQDAKRIVVKVGTSTITYDTGKINLSRIDKLSMVISDLVNQGKDVVLVTSGAIGVGVGKLKLKERPKTIMEKQAVAAVGQCELMHIYSKFFSEYGHIVGQILLTRDVVEDEYRKNNVVNTFNTLLEKGIIPIVNENDSVCVKELEGENGETGRNDEHGRNGESGRNGGNESNPVFGDNDTLSAIVACLINADLLVILTDVDGLYDCDPKENSCSRKLSVIIEITPDIERCVGGAGSKQGTGGMVTKLAAAKIATTAGIDVVLANGSNPSFIVDILKGKDIGTLFTRQV
jgi:glutamate 5-kinase